jgi:CubicO group peptidase (beta-lactamase class C family)
VDADFTDPGRVDRVRDLAPAIDALFADALGELGAPGIAYGIALDGELIHSGGCGVRDLDAGTPPDADTAFRICSMTKSFMAMTVLSLRDEGMLDIDAPLGDVVAELAPLAEAGPDAPPVTVRQLLTMDAGLPQDDPWADRLMAHDSAWVTGALFSRGATRSRAPGTFFEYSNYSWAALGRVVATVTGQRHQDVVRARVLDPLALSSTVWSAGDLPAARIATGYRPAGEGFTAEVPLADGGDFAALGGLYSTVRDLARWSGVFLGAEPPRDAPERAPVSRATLREMQRARSAFAPGVEWPSLAEPPGVIAGGYGYGLMIWHERDGQKHVGHPGGLPGYGTLMRWVPELGLSAILLANVTYAECEMPLRRALQLVAREAALPKRVIRADPGLLAARDAVNGLVARWDDAAAARLFSPNVDLDEPLAERRAGLEALAERHGALTRDGEFEPEDALRGRWRLSGERGHVELDITMAPTIPPLVQTLGVESVLPPAGLLATLATAAVDVARDPRLEALGALLSPGVDAEEVLRGFRVGAALYGPFGDPEPVAGDGESTTTLRLPSDRGAIDLELELDAGSGRLARAVLRPAS